MLKPAEPSLGSACKLCKVGTTRVRKIEPEHALEPCLLDKSWIFSTPLTIVNYETIQFYGQRDSAATRIRFF